MTKRSYVLVGSATCAENGHMEQVASASVTTPAATLGKADIAGSRMCRANMHSVRGKRGCPGAGRDSPACGAAPAAVTDNGPAEDPRVAGTGWVAVWNRDLATPVTGMPDSASG